MHTCMHIDIITFISCDYTFLQPDWNALYVPPGQGSVTLLIRPFLEVRLAMRLSPPISQSQYLLQL